MADCSSGSSPPGALTSLPGWRVGSPEEALSSGLPGPRRGGFACSALSRETDEAWLRPSWPAPPPAAGLGPALPREERYVAQRAAPLLFPLPGATASLSRSPGFLQGGKGGLGVRGPRAPRTAAESGTEDQEVWRPGPRGGSASKAGEAGEPPRRGRGAFSLGPPLVFRTALVILNLGPLSCKATVILGLVSLLSRLKRFVLLWVGGSSSA